MTRTINEIRSQFPALAAPMAFMDNAGGTQLPGVVIDAVTNYYRSTFAQLGGFYPQSLAAKATVNRGHEVVRTFLNVPAGGHVILGSSSTSLLHVVANAHADARAHFGDRNELVVCTAGHEANVWPWMRLADRGFRVIEWPVEQVAAASGKPKWSLTLEGLRARLSSRTLLVIFPQVSNILGDVWDAAAFTKAAHEVGAKVVVDGVAYAPHHLPDMAGNHFDWYVYSTYKVFGPHMAALAGTAEAFSPLVGPNHYFIPKTDLPYKFELGGVQHEGAAAIAALPEYLSYVAGMPGDSSREMMERSFRVIEELENQVGARLFSFLRSHPKVVIHGGGEFDASRVTIFSVTVKGHSSKELAMGLCERGFGVKNGDFYSRRLVEQMGVDPADGVLRISLAHTNSVAEVEGLIGAMGELIDG